MELLESSGSWIIALGKTLLNSLWLGFLMLSLLKAFFLLIPQRMAVYRYHSALFSMFLFVSLCLALFFHLYSPGRAGSITIPESSGMNAVLSYLVPEKNSGGMHFYHYISIAYLAGMGVYLAKTLAGYGKVRSLRRNARNVTGNWRHHFEVFYERAGVSQMPGFLVSEEPVTPFLTGVLKPAIIVPSAMFTQLSFTEVEAILMHELYHLKRLDHWVNLLQNVVDLLFFFNPAFRVLSAMIRNERERCCDDRVLAGQAQPLEYARALYRISNLQNSSAMRALAATGNGKGHLKSRIERILKPNVMKINIREKTNTVLVFICGIAIMILVTGFTSGLSITRYHDVPRENPEKAEAAAIPNDTLSWEEKQQLKEEIKEAMAEIDWDQIKMELEEAKTEALAEIDWDQIKKDMEEAKTQVLEEIDWEEIKMDIGEAKITVLEEINWEEISKDIEEATRSFEVEIDWEEIKTEMEEVKVTIDLMIDDMDLDMDLDIDVDTDLDRDVESDPNPAESL